MTCPRCGGDTIVLETTERIGYIYRRRACVCCLGRITSHEHVCWTDKARPPVQQARQRGRRSR